MLCCVAVAAGAVLDSVDAEASLRDVLAAALEANREQSRLAAELREDIARLRGDNARLLEENARLRARDAERDAELEKLRADFTVLQRILFGRSSEKKPAGPPPAGGDGAGEPGSGKKGVKRGPGARAGRRRTAGAGTVVPAPAGSRRR